MRPLHAILALLAFTVFAAASASGCGSNATPPCKSDGDCGGGSCGNGVCSDCPFFSYQCMCGGMPVGPQNEGTCTLGSCDLDAGPADGGAAGDGGACQCVETTMYWPCS